MNHGADHAAGSESKPSYDVQNSMSAHAAFPWVYAALLRASGDVAGLPLVVVKGRGKNATVLDEHPLYNLIDNLNPSKLGEGRRYRRQMYLDFRLTGNHFGRMIGERRAATVWRLHPRRVAIDPSPELGIGAYTYEPGNGRATFPEDEVLHISLPSWEDTPAGLWGTGAIQPLNNDLTTDQLASASASKLAKRGRPDIIVSPADKEAQMLFASKDFRKELTARLDILLKKGGSLVTSGGAKVDMPSWSPRDMEFPQLRQLVREAVLAVTGVPPHLVGLPSANYALAERQELVYWEMQTAFAKDIEDSFWNPLARQWGPEFSIRHDTSGVDVLQNARTARLNRVVSWVGLGMQATAAAAYEGFGDAPFSAVTVIPAEPPEDDGKALAKWFHPEPTREAPRLKAWWNLARGFVAPTVRAERIELWRTLDSQARDPAEKRFQTELAKALNAQQERAIKAIEGVGIESLTAGPWTQRALEDAIIDLVWDDKAEAEAMSEAMRESYRLALTDAFALGSELVGLDLSWEPDALDLATNEILANMVVNVNAETKAGIQDIMVSGLRGGETVNEMQKRIQEDWRFSPMRALRVARTEATRAVSAGQHESWKQAEAEGVTLKQQWLTAEDNLVRADHIALDGEEVDVGGLYTVPSGEEADKQNHIGESGAGPGEFDSAGMVVNCRCGEIPIVTGEFDTEP